MAAKEISVKKYVVRLSGEERERLETLIRKGKSPARRVLKARILLKANVAEAGKGWSDNRIIEALPYLTARPGTRWGPSFFAAAGGRHVAGRDRLRGWAYRIRTGESVRALSDWNCVTTSFEIGASPQSETLRVLAA